jgi:hypothetical protein
MTPAKSLALRKSTGSPSPKEQDEMLKAARTKLAGFEAGVGKRTKFVQGALGNLKKTVDKYLGD